LLDALEGIHHSDEAHPNIGWLWKSTSSFWTGQGRC